MTETGILSSQLLLNNSREIPKAKPENTENQIVIHSCKECWNSSQSSVNTFMGSGKKALKIPVKLQFSL